MVSERAGRWGFHRCWGVGWEGGGVVVGGGCHQLWLNLVAWVYPAGGATVFTGGEGKPGRVVDIRGWDVETGRSVASVTWADGTTNVYRVGHKGKVDLKCVGEAAGGFYYREHLPRLGMGGPSTTCPPHLPSVLSWTWGWSLESLRCVVWAEGTA